MGITVLILLSIFYISPGITGDSPIKDVEPGAVQTLALLEGTVVKENNPLDLAIRFKGLSEDLARKGKAIEKPVGTSEQFWVLNVDTNKYRRLNANLAYTTAHLYFWIQEDLDYDSKALKTLAESFEDNIYPTTRSIFGSEYSPGVDGDVHLTILYAEGLGSAAGYFSATDSLETQIEPYSNEAEMFYLSADYTWLDSTYTYGVLAHEFQHMIHWNVDRNEDGWLNEGLSELSVDLNGFSTGGFDYLFAIDPDIQINFWPGNDQGDSTPHYGASYLFIRYLFDRFGLNFISALVAHQDNGFSGIDKVLNELPEMVDIASEEKITEYIFQDWTLANLIQDASLENGEFGYSGEVRLPDFGPTEILTCDGQTYEREVSQFGTDYIQIGCANDFIVNIQIDREISLMPVNPISGDFYFWSNYGHESHMRLSREFDFRDVEGPIYLQYKTWFDIERDYDYLFLTAKTAKEDWIILETPSCTIENPTGANLGCGYSGKSNGWKEERVDLSMFAGKEVVIQFEYITDAAVNGDGFLIDDIRIEVLDYSSDLEADSGGWKADGFTRIQNKIPQKVGVSFFQDQSGTEPDKIITNQSLSSEINKRNGFVNSNTWLIISGLTRFTRQPTKYTLRISELD